MGRRRIWFWLLEALLWLSFLGLDFRQVMDTSAIKFAAILLCAVFAVLEARDRDSRLIAWALSLSVLADVFLLLLDRWYPIGVGIFLMVQIIHTNRLCGLRGLNPKADLILRLIIAALAVAATVQFGALAMLSAAYISWFGLNVAEALIFARTKRSSTAALYAAGLVLYFCCDLCVGLNNLSPSPITNIAMWAFYLPGQVLIASSVNPEVSST